MIPDLGVLAQPSLMNKMKEIVLGMMKESLLEKLVMK